MKILNTWMHNITKGLLLAAVVLGFALLPYGSAMAATQSYDFDNYDGQTAPSDWAPFTVDNYTSPGSAGDSENSLKFEDGDEAVLHLSPGSGEVPDELSFWMMAQPSPGDSLEGEFSVEESLDSGDTYSEVATYTDGDIPTGGDTFTADLDVDADRIRFSYDKTTGNVALDDIEVTFAQEESGSAPEFESVSPATENVELSAGQSFVWTVDAEDLDGDLHSLEIDHNYEGQLPEFTVYPDTVNPYGAANQDQANDFDGLNEGDSLEPVFDQFGVSVDYNPGLQEWEIDFGSNITGQFIQGDGVTFYIVLEDEEGNTWGSMYGEGSDEEKKDSYGDWLGDKNTFEYDLTRQKTPITGEKREIIGEGEGADVSPGSGWQITLHEYWSESDGTSDAIATTTTGPNGEYSFEDYPESEYDYIICEEDRDEWKQISPQMLGDEADVPARIQRGTCENGTVGHIVASSGGLDLPDFGDGLTPIVDQYFRFKNQRDEVAEEPGPSSGGGGGERLNPRESSSDGDVAGDQDPTSSSDEDDRASDEGEVLGAQDIESCADNPYLTDYMHPDADNDPQEVLKLQLFLNLWTDAGLALTSTYDEATEQAVMDFQLQHADDVLSPWGESEATGYVYITTQAKINALLCDDLAGQELPPLVPDTSILN